LGPAWEKTLAKLPKLYAQTHFLNTLINKNNQVISNQGIVDYSIEIEPSVAESISKEAAYLEEQRLTLINQDGELDLFDKKN
jgi:peptidase E